jgi:hypothetical protein
LGLWHQLNALALFEYYLTLFLLCSINKINFVKAKTKLTIYPTNATLVAGKINYAPLGEVNRLYKEHTHIL